MKGCGENIAGRRKCCCEEGEKRGFCRVLTTEPTFETSSEAHVDDLSPLKEKQAVLVGYEEQRRVSL